MKMLLVKTMNPYNTDTIQLECIRKDTKMQEKEDKEVRERAKKLFPSVCTFPCGILATVIEMEHRVNGESYEELKGIAAKVLDTEIEKQGQKSDMEMLEESEKLETLHLINNLSMETIADVLMPGLEDMLKKLNVKFDKEGESNVM